MINEKNEIMCCQKKCQPNKKMMKRENLSLSTQARNGSHIRLYLKEKLMDEKRV
jgi:hypothetical protein